MIFGTQWQKAAGAALPSLIRVPPHEFSSLVIDAAFIDRLLKNGVPFHMAGDKKQDEHPNPAHAAKRLAAGETLYLVQPHEYMPRLRRFLYQLSASAGFQGRTARTFLFRVDVPGREAMGMHDDGATDLAWLQFSGERYVTFGTQGAKGRKRALIHADGQTPGWFQGGQPAGTLLYLPPWAPHEVRCRKPSIAVSIYWEETSPEEALVDLAAHALDAQKQRKVPTDLQLDRVLRRLEQARAARDEWRALKLTDDGGRDRPARAGRDWADPETKIVAWRALRAWRHGREAKLAAGGEAILTFPVKTLPALQVLSGYGQATRKELARKSKLSSKELTHLLEILSAEGLITQGDLPLLGDFVLAELTGWEYAVA